MTPAKLFPSQKTEPNLLHFFQSTNRVLNNMAMVSEEERLNTMKRFPLTLDEEMSNMLIAIIQVRKKYRMAVMNKMGKKKKPTCVVDGPHCSSKRHVRLHKCGLCEKLVCANCSRLKNVGNNLVRICEPCHKETTDITKDEKPTCHVNGCIVNLTKCSVCEKYGVLFARNMFA